MYKPGLVSISFRDKTPDEIIEYSSKCGLKGIEWGSDIHVPAGDIKSAEHVKKLSEEKGLECFSYGSYFRLGEGADILPYISTAKALGTNLIRIWGGNKSPNDLTDADFNSLVNEAKAVSEIAEKNGIVLALECHCNTVTQDFSTALRFLDTVAFDKNFLTYWQPNQFQSFEYNLKAARALKPYTVGIHVFKWDDKKRYPLKYGHDEWKAYLDVFSGNGDIPLMLEFMHDDRIESLKPTAESLLELIKETES